MTNLSFKRKITDYTKVQKVIAKLVRGKKTFFRNKRINNIEYLNIGCGPNPNQSFVNLDYNWTPEIDICWDLNNGTLPFKDNSFIGIFSEHCFEHISLEKFKMNMLDVYRILKPNGTLRLIMPDGELYLDIYQKRKQGSNQKMPYEHGYISPMHRINGIFRSHGHLFIYDFETLNIILKEIGFKNVVKEAYLSGRDKNLLIDTESRAIESLYVEAVK